MTKRIFIWVAHPVAGSLSASLADAYQKGAEALGADVRRMDLSDMTFDSEVSGITGKTDLLEPDLQAWQANIDWADHLLFLHPYWWAAMPAKAKSVLDRALISGFAYKYHARGMGWDKLLTGKTGDAIITSDTPPWLDTLVYRKPGRRTIRNQVFKFCGIQPRKIVQIGSVKLAKPETIQKWIGNAEALGHSAAA